MIVIINTMVPEPIEVEINIPKPKPKKPWDKSPFERRHKPKRGKK